MRSGLNLGNDGLQFSGTAGSPAHKKWVMPVKLGDLVILSWSPPFLRGLFWEWEDRSCVGKMRQVLACFAE